MSRRLLGIWAALSISCMATNPALAQAPTAAPTTVPTAAPTAASAPATVVRAPVPLTQLTAENFGRIPFIEAPSLSPDGTNLAGLIGANGQQMVAMVNLADHSDHLVRILVPDGTEARWVRWVNADNIVVGLSANIDFEGSRFVVSRLIAVNRLTGKITRLKWDLEGQDVSLVWSASDGSPVVLVEGQATIYTNLDGFWPAVFKVNVENGRAVQVLGGRGGVIDWSADSNGVVRAGVSIDDSHRTSRLLYRNENNQSFRTADTANSRQREVLTSPFMFLPDGDHALTIHGDEHGRDAIYEIDMLTGEDVRQVYAAPDGQEVTHAIVSDDGKTLLGAGLSGSGHAVHWLDAELAMLQDGFDKAVAAAGGRRARIVSLSADRQRMLVQVDRPDSPGAIFFFDTGGDRMSLVSHINPDLRTRPLAEVRVVHYTARDGTPIEAILTLPRDRAQQNLPIVLLPHGGPWAQDTPDYDYWAQFIATRGYAVLQPNFRGSTGYGTTFERMGEGQMGLAMQDDVTDALQWAAKQGIADPRRACIIGGSYGGYAAMWGIAKDPDLYRCAVSVAGVSNVQRDINSFGEYLQGGTFRDEWRRMAPDVAAISPINAIDRIKAPLLLIHGRKDVRVDFSQSQKMYDRMKGAGKQVELLALDQADHHFTREADRIALLKAVERFLAANNPADPPPAGGSASAAPAKASR